MGLKSLTRTLYFPYFPTMLIGKDILTFYFSDNFCQFDESPGICTSKTCYVETNPVHT